MPFLINCTRTHFRIAEFGCFASTPTFSRTMPLAWEEPPNGDDLKAVPRALFLYWRSAHLWSRRLFRNFRAAFRPRGFPLPILTDVCRCLVSECAVECRVKRSYFVLEVVRRQNFRVSGPRRRTYPSCPKSHFFLIDDHVNQSVEASHTRRVTDGSGTNVAQGCMYVHTYST